MRPSISLAHHVALPVAATEVAVVKSCWGVDFGVLSSLNMDGPAGITEESANFAFFGIVYAMAYVTAYMVRQSGRSS